MLNLRVCVLALALVWATGCGEEFVASNTGDGGGAQQASGASSTSSGGAGQGGTATAGAGPGSSMGPGGAGGVPGTTSTSGGSGGAAVGFQATCSGKVDCPDMPGCADWQYTVDDDGTTTMVKASVDVASSGMSCSDQAQYASSQDEGLQVTGNIMFPCGLQTWSFGIDRQTQLVYVKEMTMGYSWTPPCE